MSGNDRMNAVFHQKCRYCSRFLSMPVPMGMVVRMIVVVAVMASSSPHRVIQQGRLRKNAICQIQDQEMRRISKVLGYKALVLVYSKRKSKIHSLFCDKDTAR